MEEASSSSNPAQSGAQSINAADTTVGALASQDFPSPTYGRSRHYQQQRLQFGAYPTSNTPFSLFSANSRPHEVLEFVEDGDDAAIASGSASTSADETLDATAAVGVSVAAAAASPPQECYYRPDGGVTLRQNPLSDEESADDYTHQQDHGWLRLFSSSWASRGRVGLRCVALSISQNTRKSLMTMTDIYSGADSSG